MDLIKCPRAAPGNTVLSFGALWLYRRLAPLTLRILLLLVQKHLIRNSSILCICKHLSFLQQHYLCLLSM